MRCSEWKKRQLWIEIRPAPRPSTSSGVAAGREPQAQQRDGGPEDRGAQQVAAGEQRDDVGAGVERELREDAGGGEGGGRGERQRGAAASRGGRRDGGR